MMKFKVDKRRNLCLILKLFLMKKYFNSYEV